jgi:hypothetical protein
VAVVVIALTGVTGAGTGQIDEGQIANTLNPLEIQKLKAQGQIEINQANASTITIEDNTKYFLSQNIETGNNGIKINNKNVTIDCMGHSITAPSHRHTIMTMEENANEITIKNCKMNNGSRGILVESNSSPKIELKDVEICGNGFDLLCYGGETISGNAKYENAGGNCNVDALNQEVC